jgi:hypothetical protein
MTDRWALFGPEHGRRAEVKLNHGLEHKGDDPNKRRRGQSGGQGNG